MKHCRVITTFSRRNVPETEPSLESTCSAEPAVAALETPEVVETVEGVFLVLPWERYCDLGCQGTHRHYYPKPDDAFAMPETTEQIAMEIGQMSLMRMRRMMLSLWGKRICYLLEKLPLRDYPGLDRVLRLPGLMHWAPHWCQRDPCLHWL